MGVEVRVLGSLDVVVDGRSVQIGGPKPRALLAVLAARGGAVVSVDALADALWEGSPPGQPGRSVQVYVSAVRKALGVRDVALRSVPGGYRLDLAADEQDAAIFEALVRSGRSALEAGDARAAADDLGRALGLWRGPAYAGLEADAVRAEAQRLDERRLDAYEWRLEAELALGHHREVLGEIEHLAGAHPYRERLQATQVLALYRAGRRADALAAYTRTRRLLADELGLEPGPELRALHTAVLREDPALTVEPAELRARRHLPAPAGLVGRTAEIAAAVEALSNPEVRLLTLTGPGGIGKTRIGLQAAYDLAAVFPDGVWFVGLAPLTSAELVASTIARALGVDESTAGAVAALHDYLCERRLLLLCDNFEHVDEAAPVISGLLAAAPGVKVLVTSRVALRLYGEHVRALPTLDLDDEAVPLFGARAGAVIGRPPGWIGSHQDGRQTIAAICQRLDRLPLAIELVAARADEIPLADLLVAVEHRLDVATSGPRDLPARQRTLRAAIDWSYQLLHPAERAVFVRLGVLADGFDAAAASAVAGASPGQLASLARKSLLASQADQDVGVTMLETIREYALEQLRSDDAEEATREAHAAYYVELADRAEEGMRGPDQLEWTARVETAHDSLRTALGWLDDRPATDRDSRETRLRLAAALSGFWYRTGRATEGSRWREKALAGSDDLPDLLRGRTLHGLGILQSMRNQAEQARSTFGASGEIFRRLGELGQLARSLNSQGGVARDQGEPAEARRLLEESLALWRSVGDRSRIGLVLGNLGLVARDEMDLPRARALLEEGLAIDAEHNNVWGAASKLLSLAIVALDEGDLGSASDLLGRCAAHYAELGERHGLTEAVDVAAWIAAADDDHRRAARLGGAAEAERGELGIVLGPNDIELAGRHLRPARTALGDQAFAAAWADGQRLGFREALAEAGLAGREVSDDLPAGSLPLTLTR